MSFSLLKDEKLLLIVTSPIENFDLKTMITAVNIGVFTAFNLKMSHSSIEKLYDRV